MAIKTTKAIKISQKHLLGIQDLSDNDCLVISDIIQLPLVLQNNLHVP